ncbi:hypothetical protein ABZ926_36630 [Streptomyces litmocidini]|uniref:hypothetical protein n=1 Tax=Streptomyces litmocidini TaxID=67318 RepID=UPI0033C87AB5
MSFRYFTPIARISSWLTDPPRSSLAPARSETESAPEGMRSSPVQAAPRGDFPSVTFVQVAPSS